MKPKEISILVNEEGEESFDPKQLFNIEDFSDEESELLKNYQLSERKGAARNREKRTESVNLNYAPSQNHQN